MAGHLSARRDTLMCSRSIITEVPAMLGADPEMEIASGSGNRPLGGFYRGINGRAGGETAACKHADLFSKRAGMCSCPNIAALRCQARINPSKQRSGAGLGRVYDTLLILHGDGARLLLFWCGGLRPDGAQAWSPDAKRPGPTHRQPQARIVR